MTSVYIEDINMAIIVISQMYHDVHVRLIEVPTD